MTTLATGTRPDDIESGGVGPLILVARQAHGALANSGRSRGQTGRAEELERSGQLTRAIGLRIYVSEDAKPTAGRYEVMKLA